MFVVFTQAWDPFENGNNWRQLVRRRRTDLALSRAAEVKNNPLNSFVQIIISGH